MIKFNKVLICVLISTIFLKHSVAFCLPSTISELRPPLLTSETGKEWLELPEGHKEALVKLYEYLKIEKGSNDPKRDNAIIEEIRQIGGSVQVLVDIMKKDSRAWMRAKAASALGSLHTQGLDEIPDALFEQLSQEKSVMVRSIIARKSLIEIKKKGHISQSLVKKIEEQIEKADLNPWLKENGLKVLDAGCYHGEATHGMAKYYTKKGFVDVVVAGVDLSFPSIIEAEKNRQDPNIAFILGDLDKDEFGKADIIISKNLLLYNDEMPQHAKSLKRHLNSDGGTIYYSPSLYSEGSDGQSTLLAMGSALEKLFPDAGHKRYGGYKSAAQNPFDFKITEPVFESTWGKSAGWAETQLPSAVTIRSGNDLVRMRTDRFPDGEFYLRILNPKAVKDADIKINCSLDNADDLVKIVLIMDLLHMYGANNIQLTLDRSYEVNNGLDRLLRYFCDGIIRPQKEEQAYKNLISEPRYEEIDVEPLEPAREKVSASWINSVLYEHKRLKNDANQTARSIKLAKSMHIGIVKEGDNPLDWKVNLPEDLKGKNVVLVHSTENSIDISELWLMLIALRSAEVSSVYLINTYEGYSRQDKAFNNGEGISAITMLKTVDPLVDMHMALNVHYADRSGLINVAGYEIFNLNSFIQVAEGMLGKVVGWLGEKGLAGEFQAHPLWLIGPDDGALGYIKEAAEQLEIYIKKKHGIDIDVHYGYMDKKRLGGKKVTVTDRILGEDGNPVRNINVKDCWMLVIDDETSWGSTLLAADYALVIKAGASWSRVLTGVVHGKLARGLEAFRTGLEEKKMIKALKEGQDIMPKQEYINKSEEWMPPRSFMCTRSVELPPDFSEENAISLGPIVSHAVKRLISINTEELVKKHPGISITLQYMLDYFRIHSDNI